MIIKSFMMKRKIILLDLKRKLIETKGTIESQFPNCEKVIAKRRPKCKDKNRSETAGLQASDSEILWQKLTI